jgi:hypothetical protein
MDENMLSRAGFSMLRFEPVTNTPGRVRGPHQGGSPEVGKGIRDARPSRDWGPG